MPRDYTELLYCSFPRMYSPVHTAVSNTSMIKKEQAAKATKNAKSPKPVRVKQRQRNDNNNIKSVAIAYSNKQQFNSRSKKSERFRNEELIGDVTGSVGFSISNTYYLNPGLIQTFPWLGTQATKWQQYRFHKLQFKFVTRTSTSTTGSVILSPDYNAIELTPSSEQAATNTQDAVEDVCWNQLTCVLDPSAMFPIGPRKQIRSSGVPGDLSSYDAGRFFVCCVGMPSTAVIGKLWVQYDVELFVPQNSLPTLGPVSMSQFSNSNNQIIGSGVATTVQFDQVPYDPLKVGPVVSGVFTPPAGTYNIVGFIVVQCTTAGNMNGNVKIFFNGIAIVNNIFPQFAMTTSGLAPTLPLPINDIVVCSGTDTVELKAQITGSGTVQILNTNCLTWVRI